MVSSYIGETRRIGRMVGSLQRPRGSGLSHSELGTR